ncbi:hypothetical protein GLOIN_2v1735823 [Rhizophagus clarus]|uniref:Uncharacterized protein n=1 Tax=Rhizophagus clarus TaxID=94130 RepID=A0A8H3LP83_9GLOM|nr:hypothetical protein GLOIN_2v1735823 [Rhizophagus clarus]
MHTEVLRANEEYNEMRNAENVKLKAIIEELKSENVELRDYVTKVKESKAEQASLNQDQESDIRCSTSEKISEVINPVTKISAGAPSQNSYRKKGAENIIQLIADGIIEDAISLRPTQLSDKAIICDIILIESLNQNSSTDPLLSLAQLFDKADDTEYGAIQANQEEILRWYYYRKEFLNQVSVIVQDNKGKIGEKKAKRIVYDKMLEHLSMLRKKTQKAVKIYKLFEKVDIDNIKYITTYSANSISELTNNKVQKIIDNFFKQNPKELHLMSLKDKSSIPEISARALAKIMCSKILKSAKEL